jgi:hypothetical protein
MLIKQKPIRFDNYKVILDIRKLNLEYALAF